MKPHFWRIFWCLVPVVVSALVVGGAYSMYSRGEGGFRLGVDLAGGTILVYQVDRTKELDVNYKPEELAAALKRRIDPADLYNVTIRPVQGDPPRVEIILPTGGRHQSVLEDKAWRNLLQQTSAEYPPPEGKSYDDLPRGNREALVARIIEFEREKDPNKSMPTEKIGQIEDFVNNVYASGKSKRQLTGEEVENIKALIAQQGRLDFRILANFNDDAEACKAAQAYVKDPANKAELDRLNRAGKAPPDPTGPGGVKTFPVELAGETSQHSYSWVEIGKNELYTLHLNSDAKNDPNPSFRVAWQQMEAARDKEAIQSPAALPLNSCLLYSRTILNQDRVAPKDRGKTVEYFVLVRNPEKGKDITGDALLSARQGYDQYGGLAVDFSFKTEGANLLSELTQQNRPASRTSGFKRHMAIILDGQVQSAPSLITHIGNGRGQITGKFTLREIEDLVRILRAGALPATLKPQPVSENTMGATLGEETITKGTWSVGLAFLAVVAFMIFYYRFAGVVACIALLANLLLTVAFMVLINAAFTLPGLAGLVLMLGMAVDANVLIYERLREERERGASLALAIRQGYDRAFPTIIDTHLSSIFTAIVLYVVGNDQLKGFGISLTVGLIISLFTSLYMTRTMFDYWMAKGWLPDLRFRQLFHRPNIDFMAIRYYFFAGTVIATILGAALFVHRAIDKSGLNIDFTGGTLYTGVLTEPMTRADLGHILEGKTTLPDLTLEQVFLSDANYSKGNASRLFTVRTSEKDAVKVQDEINRLLGNKLQIIQLQEYTIDKDNKRATLKFSDFASKAQVGRLLEQELENNGLRDEARQMRLDRGPGTEEREGRLTSMVVELPTALDRSRLEGILKETKTQFEKFPQPERLENFDSQLAASTQERALYAILASWAALLLYLWFRFGNWTFGAATVLCLIHDLFFTLGAIAACHYIYGTPVGNFLLIGDFKIDLPSIAALLTLVGYSVSDTIVVFDRIREVRGKNPLLTPQIINDSVNQTLSRTVLSSLTVWLVVIVLYIFGGEGVHLFAFVMIVGVVVGTYSSIYIASPLLLIFGEGAPSAADRARLRQQAAAVEARA